MDTKIDLEDIAAAESPPTPTNGHVGGKTFLDAADILRIDDVRIEDVWVPEWQTWVRVRGLTGAQRDMYEASITIGKGPNQTINARNARAKLVVLCAIKPDGSALFKHDQIAALGAKSASSLQRIFDVARKLTGLSDEDLDEMTEGFDPAQNAASTSG